jgi:hypothetical protein
MPRQKAKATLKRRYVCQEPGCTLTEGYVSLGDLSRHQRECHSNIRFLCPVSGCPRSVAGHGFKRRYRMDKHVRDWHGSASNHDGEHIDREGPEDQHAGEPEDVRLARYARATRAYSMKLGEVLEAIDEDCGKGTEEDEVETTEQIAIAHMRSHIQALMIHSNELVILVSGESGEMHK